MSLPRQDYKLTPAEVASLKSVNGHREGGAGKGKEGDSELGEHRDG